MFILYSFLLNHFVCSFLFYLSHVYFVVTTLKYGIYHSIFKTSFKMKIGANWSTSYYNDAKAWNDNTKNESNFLCNLSISNSKQIKNLKKPCDIPNYILHLSLLFVATFSSSQYLNSASFVLLSILAIRTGKNIQHSTK